MYQCKICGYISNRFYNINDIKKYLAGTGDELASVMIDHTKVNNSDMFCPECFELVSEETDYDIVYDDDFIYEMERDIKWLHS